MRARGSLKKRFEERLQRSAINTAIEINDAGLVFGAGTVLARMTRGAGGAPHLDLDTDRQRVFARLAAAYGRTVSPDVFRHIEGASEQYRRGEKALDTPISPTRFYRSDGRDRPSGRSMPAAGAVSNGSSPNQRQKKRQRKFLKTTRNASERSECVMNPHGRNDE